MPLFLLLAGAAFSADADGVAYFEAKVRPILVERCYECHSAGAKKLKGDLRLDEKAAWLKGGANGPAVVPGAPDQSPLIHAVRRRHADIAAMPPDKPLPAEQVASLVEWVRQGAPAPDAAPAAGTKAREPIAAAVKRWPFTPLPAEVPVPPVKDAAWPRAELDRFLLAKLEAAGLKPVGDADRRTLLRRVSYDLVGLPPTPAELDAFLADPAPDAFAKVVDRLLASPGYGERWGRHWLDVVRYADTAGDNSDFPVPQLYLYRNWVIDAVNRDLPFDQFVKEQLAGDLMDGRDDAERRARTIATGYLAGARRFGSRVDDYPWHLTIEDTLDNLGRAFLGLTVNCARCHDHKFDPVDSADYYALYGVFASTRYPWPGIELEQRQRDLVPLAPAEQAKALLAERDRLAKDFEKRINKLYGEKGKAKDDAARKAIDKQVEALKKEQRQATAGKLPFPTAYAMAEGGKIGDAAIQQKGDPAKPGAVVPRRFLTALGGQALPKDDRSSGRRALAEWIAAERNPLFARVFVNRVWQHHFGRGIVATPNDFGKQGAPPTHPELLDWLARTFVQDGWSLKRLHRRLLLSRAYGLASSGTAAGAETKDANNDLLWKFRRRRLDAESLRDTLLAVAGNLDRTPGGEHPFPDPTTWQFTQHNPFRAAYETEKRSVYLMTQRTLRHPYLAVFDGPDPNASAGRRVSSTTALQALYFLNDPFVHAQAKRLAGGARAAASTDGERIAWTYRLLFGRVPAATETARGEAFLADAAKELGSPAAAWESYLRALFRANEFVYVD